MSPQQIEGGADSDKAESVVARAAPELVEDIVEWGWEERCEKGRKVSVSRKFMI